MARTEQEIFEEILGDGKLYDNSFVPEVHHTVYDKDGEDVSGLEVELYDIHGDLQYIVLSLDIVEEFCEELVSYKKGIIEAIASGGLEDA